MLKFRSLTCVALLVVVIIAAAMTTESGAVPLTTQIQPSHQEQVDIVDVVHESGGQDGPKPLVAKADEPKPSNGSSDGLAPSLKSLPTSLKDPSDSMLESKQPAPIKNGNDGSSSRGMDTSKEQPAKDQDGKHDAVADNKLKPLHLENSGINNNSPTTILPPASSKDSQLAAAGAVKKQEEGQVASNTKPKAALPAAADAGWHPPLVLPSNPNSSSSSEKNPTQRRVEKKAGGEEKQKSEEEIAAAAKPKEGTKDHGDGGDDLLAKKSESTLPPPPTTTIAPPSATAPASAIVNNNNKDKKKDDGLTVPLPMKGGGVGLTSDEDTGDEQCDASDAPPAVKQAIQQQQQQHKLQQQQDGGVSSGGSAAPAKQKENGKDDSENGVEKKKNMMEEVGDQAKDQPKKVADDADGDDGGVDQITSSLKTSTVNSNHDDKTEEKKEAYVVHVNKPTANGGLVKEDAKVERTLKKKHHNASEDATEATTGQAAMIGSQEADNQLQGATDAVLQTKHVHSRSDEVEGEEKIQERYSTPKKQSVGTQTDMASEDGKVEEKEEGGDKQQQQGGSGLSIIDFLLSWIMGGGGAGEKKVGDEKATGNNGEQSAPAADVEHDAVPLPNNDDKADRVVKKKGGDGKNEEVGEVEEKQTVAMKKDGGKKTGDAPKIENITMTVKRGDDSKMTEIDETEVIDEGKTGEKLVEKKRELIADHHVVEEVDEVDKLYDPSKKNANGGDGEETVVKKKAVVEAEEEEVLDEVEVGEEGKEGGIHTRVFNAVWSLFSTITHGILNIYPSSSSTSSSSTASPTTVSASQ